MISWLERQHPSLKYELEIDSVPHSGYAARIYLLRYGRSTISPRIDLNESLHLRARHGIIDFKSVTTSLRCSRDI